jgi:hypothetical protein
MPSPEVQAFQDTLPSGLRVKWSKNGWVVEGPVDKVHLGEHNIVKLGDPMANGKVYGYLRPGTLRPQRLGGWNTGGPVKARTVAPTPEQLSTMSLADAQESIRENLHGPSQLSESERAQLDAHYTRMFLAGIEGAYPRGWEPTPDQIEAEKEKA